MFLSEKNKTFGEKVVGLTFNPAEWNEVIFAKDRFATLIDQMDKLRSETTSGEVKRLCSIAITEAQGAQMWAVKAITWQD